MSYINKRTLARNRISDNVTIAAPTSPPPIRAELSGSRRCSTLGIVVNAYAPVLTLARQLIRAGFPPDRILEVYRGATLCFRVPLAVAARLTVEDSSDRPPRFRQYRSPSWEVGPPIVPNDLAATPLAEPLQKTPSAERADEALRQLEQWQLLRRHVS